MLQEKYIIADESFLPSQTEGFGQKESHKQLIENTKILHQLLVKAIKELQLDSLIQSDEANSREFLWLRYILSADYKPEWLEKRDQKACFDVEGVKNLDDNEMSFGLAVSLDNKGDVRYWPPAFVEELANYLLKFPEIITFFGMFFDNWTFSRAGIDSKRMQQLYNCTLDLNYAAKAFQIRYPDKMKLDTLAKRAIQRGKYKNPEFPIEGADVPELLASNDSKNILEVWKYCFEDVVLTSDVYAAYDFSESFRASIYFFIIQEAINNLDALYNSLNKKLPILDYDEELQLPYSNLMKRPSEQLDEWFAEHFFSREDRQKKADLFTELEEYRPKNITDEIWEEIKNPHSYYEDPVFQESDDIEKMAKVNEILTVISTLEPKTNAFLLDVGNYKRFDLSVALTRLETQNKSNKTGT